MFLKIASDCNAPYASAYKQSENIYIYLYVYIYIYIYIYLYTHINKYMTIYIGYIHIYVDIYDWETFYISNLPAARFRFGPYRDGVGAKERVRRPGVPGIFLRCFAERVFATEMVC